MLTLNSNILKIGNKWVIPHSGSGPTPPTPEPPEYDEYWLTVTTGSSHRPICVHNGMINGHNSGNALDGLYYNPDTGEGTLTGNDLRLGATASAEYAGSTNAMHISLQLDVTEALTSLSFSVYVEASATITLFGYDSSTDKQYQLARATIGASSGSYVYQNVTMDLSGTVYNVTCTDDGNGTLSSNLAGGITGSLAGLTATPDSGYIFDSYTLVSGTGASISGNTLTIGTSNVTVRGDFVAQVVSYNYLLVELTGYDSNSYWYGNGGGYYGLKSVKFNGSSVTSSNCKAGYREYMNNNRAYVITDDINALAYTGNYTTSPFFWGEKYESAYSEMYARTYILVGTGTAITSGTISFEDLLQNSNVPSSGGVTITSKLYGVPSSAVSGSFVTLSACTLLNTGTHTANYVSYSSYPVRTLNTTTLSYGV